MGGAPCGPFRVEAEIRDFYRLDSRSPMFKSILSFSIPTVAFYLLLEAWRSRLPLLVLGILTANLGLAWFIGELAVTETQATQAALLAAWSRLTAVYLLTLFCVGSLAREFNDKGAQLLFAAPLSRGEYFLGKAVGLAALAVGSALLFSLPLLLYAPPLAVAYWAASLACELLLMGFVGMLCAIGLNHTTQALSAALGFYLLARVIQAMQFMAESGWRESASPADQIMAGGVYVMALLLPDLDRFTVSAWLLYSPPDPPALWTVLIQTGIYLALLTGMILFDLYRKEP